MPAKPILFCFLQQQKKATQKIRSTFCITLPWDEIESPSHWLQQSALPLSYQGIKVQRPK